MKRLLCITIILMLCLTGCSKDTSSVFSSSSSGDSLETYEEEEAVIVEESVIDNTGDYSEEELDDLYEEVIAFVEEYYAAVFNFDGSGEDLSSFFLDDGDTTVADYRDSYFNKLNQTSTYTDFSVFQFVVNNIQEDYTDICVMGSIQIHGSLDELEEDDYSVYGKIVIDKMDGEWKIYSNRLTFVSPAGEMYAAETDYTATNTISIYCNQVFIYDFEGEK